MQIKTTEEVLAQLRREIVHAGSQRQWAVDNNCRPATVHEIVNGRRPMSASVAKAMGYTKRVDWIGPEPVDPK